MSVSSQILPRKLQHNGRCIRTSTISERTIYSPTFDSSFNDDDSIVNQLEIHEASVDVKINEDSHDDYQQSLRSMESSVSQVTKTFGEISLIKELGQKVRQSTESADDATLLVEGFGELLLHNQIKIIESSDYKTGKAKLRNVYLFQKALVIFKTSLHGTYDKAYSLTELILNNNLLQRYDEQIPHSEPFLFFIRQVPADDTALTPIRYINIYFKKKEDAEVFAKTFTVMQQSLLSCQMIEKADLESHYEITDNLDNLYHGILSGDEASMLLRGTPNGIFFIRFSTTQMRFAIALSFQGRVFHLRIEEAPEGNVYFDEKFQFRSIKDLVNTYRKKNLRECFNHLPIVLKTPYKDCRLYQALYAYLPTKKDYLNIRPGDIIQLLDSSMSEAGWLFGKMNINGEDKTGLFPSSYAVSIN